MDNQPVVLECMFSAPLPAVWNAITERNEMERWYFKLAAFKAEVGFEFQFTAGEEGGQQYLHLCRITEVIPQKKLSYTWRYDGYEGESLLTFELFPQGNQTRLVLTHAGLETFPASNPAFAKENFEGGWTYFLDTSLKGYLTS